MWYWTLPNTFQHPCYAVRRPLVKHFWCPWPQFEARAAPTCPWMPSSARQYMPNLQRPGSANATDIKGLNVWIPTIILTGKGGMSPPSTLQAGAGAMRPLFGSARPARGRMLRGRGSRQGTTRDCLDSAGR